MLHCGSCLCSRIRFELDADPGEFGYCHCRACQKASGSAYAANAPIDRQHVRFVASETLREFESSPGKIRSFCANCGSPIYAYLTRSPELLRIRLGTLDTHFAMQPRAHTWVSEKAAWESIQDELPQFETWATRDVLHQRGSRQDLIE